MHVFLPSSWMKAVPLVEGVSACQLSLKVNCLLNSEVLLLQQAWFTGVRSRHFRRVKMMQLSWFKKLFLVAFGLFNFLKSWVESYAGYWMTDLPSDSVPGGSNFLFSRGKRLYMRGGRGLQILAFLTPGFLLICIRGAWNVFGMSF